MVHKYYVDILKVVSVRASTVQMNLPAHNDDVSLDMIHVRCHPA